jgi:hypothetical protein
MFTEGKHFVCEEKLRITRIFSGKTFLPALNKPKLSNKLNYNMLSESYYYFFCWMDTCDVFKLVVFMSVASTSHHHEARMLRWAHVILSPNFSFLVFLVVVGRLVSFEVELHDLKVFSTKVCFIYLSEGSNEVKQTQGKKIILKTFLICYCVSTNVNFST